MLDQCPEGAPTLRSSRFSYHDTGQSTDGALTLSACPSRGNAGLRFTHAAQIGLYVFQRTERKRVLQAWRAMGWAASSCPGPAAQAVGILGHPDQAICTCWGATLTGGAGRLGSGSSIWAASAPTLTAEASRRHR